MKNGSAFVLVSAIVLGGLVVLYFANQGPSETTPSPRELVVDTASNGAIGGLAWLDPSTIVIVRDAKNYDRLTFAKYAGTPYAELPVAIATKGKSGFAIENIPLTVSSDPDLLKQFAPSDLEAICVPVEPIENSEAVEVTNEKITIIASESGTYKSDLGQLFLIEVTKNELTEYAGEWAAEVIGFENLPEDPSGLRQVEGLACFKEPGGTFSLLLGYRGKNLFGGPNAGRSGEIALYGGADFKGSTPLKLLASNPVSLSIAKPKCIAGLNVSVGEWRNIADLHVASDGSILAIASFDASDDGPFCSTLYHLPHKVSYRSGQWALENKNVTESIHAIDNFKVEALISKSPKSDEFLYGYDNENLGSGIIAP